MRDVDSKLRQAGGCDASFSGCTAAPDHPLGEQSLKDTGRERKTGRRDAEGGAVGVEGEWSKYLRDLAEAVDERERLHHVVDFIVDRRVEDAVATADNGLLIVERIPGEAEAWRKVVLVSMQCLRRVSRS